MNLKTRRWRSPALFLPPLALAALAGCISGSRQEVYDDMYQNRAAAYEAWKSAKAGQKVGIVVLRDEKVTMDAAVLLAMGNNKDLKAILEQKENAEGRITEAWAAALPNLNLSESLTRMNRPVIGAANNASVQLALTQPLFRGGAIEAGINAARLFRYLADEQVASVVQDVAFKTRQQYLDVLYARELVAVSEGDLDLSKKHLADVQKKKAAGVLSQYDVLRAQVDVTNVEAQLIQRQNSLHLGLATLLKTMGVSQESRVELTTTLDYRVLRPDVDATVKAAYHDRPEILQAELNIRLQREALVSAKSGFYPRLDADITRLYGKPDPRNPANNSWESAWNYGLTLSWPVFDGLATWGRVRQARADLQRKIIELAGAEEQVLLDVTQAVLSLEDAEKFVQSQSGNKDLAKEALRLAEEGYKAGVKTELEMLDARQTLSQTQALYYQAVYQHETAKLALEHATGVLRNARPGGTDK